MDISENWVFHSGITSTHELSYRGRRRNAPRDRPIQPPAPPTAFVMWEARQNQTPEPGTLRLFDPLPAGAEFNTAILWSRDLTLTDWLDRIHRCERDVSDNTLANSLRPPEYLENIRTIFATMQRKRWLARVVLRKWTQRVWRKRTQCNIDMIDMKPIADSDAIFLTDTKHRQIFRFHRRDVYSNLLSNICMSDDMLPAPRIPTNPWTNSPLTTAQTIGICHEIVVDFGKRGRCPPTLFAAFWTARFNLRRFQKDNSAVLAQHAIASYFKDLHSENMLTVFDTITILLTAAHLDFSYMAIRRWLRQTPQTSLHREWLRLVQDYTLYLNMHVQPRSHWYSEEMIYMDVRRLYARTVLPDTIPAQVRIIGSILPAPAESPNPSDSSDYSDGQSPYVGVLGIPMLAEISWQAFVDISGTDTTALQLIQSALFR